LRLKLGNGLIFLNLLSGLLIVVIIFLPHQALRIIIGFPFVLFLPGYALVSALFPEKNAINSARRIIYSLGASIIVVPLIGIMLNYTPWGITLESMLYTLASFTLGMSIIAWVRTKRSPEKDRLSINFRLRWPDQHQNARDKITSVALVIAIVGTLGMLGYALATAGNEEKFTEFYILGAEEQAAGYPSQLKVSEARTVTLGITNYEYETQSYRVEIKIDGEKNSEVQPVILQHDETWQQEVSFTPNKAGYNQPVEFLLFKGDESEPCLEPLRIWIDVTE